LLRGESLGIQTAFSEPLRVIDWVRSGDGERGEKVCPLQFSTTFDVILSPLPCMRQLSSQTLSVLAPVGYKAGFPRLSVQLYRRCGHCHRNTVDPSME
jgi:hypothetical protein